MTISGSSWKRLIRFRGEDGVDHYGEPQIGDAEDLSTKVEKGLEAEILEGRDLIELKSTGRIIKVKEILHLLEPKDVPTVRCIGLNYKAHSKYCSCLSWDPAHMYSNSRRSRTQTATIPLTIHQAQYLNCRLERRSPNSQDSPGRASRLRRRAFDRHWQDWEEYIQGRCYILRRRLRYFE